MPTQDQINAALKAGYTQDQIQRAITVGTSRQPSFLQKAGNLAMDVLNTPSYLVGGAIKGAREGTGLLRGSVGAVKQGFSGENAPTVYEQLPKAFGLKDGSMASTLVGLGGELLTPNIPIAGLLGKGAKALGGVAKIGKLGKMGGVTQDIGRTLLEKSYKLSASDIDKIAESIGATNPATKAVKVIDYLESLGLKGSTRGSLAKLGNTITQKQGKFNKLTRTGMGVSRQPFIDQLLQAAIDAEKADTPQSRQIAKKLFEEAYTQSRRSGVMTDTELTDKISRLFSEAGESAISDPTSANIGKQIAKAGQSAREVLRPGSTAMGRDLRGLKTTQEVIAKKANTGLGTQLVNAFKPSALGFGVGAGVGAARGENPLAAGVIGAGVGIAANNPAAMNTIGKLFRGSNLPKLPTVKIPSKITNRVIDTAIRTPNLESQRQSQKRQEQSKQQKSYYSIAPKNVFKNKAAFGGSFKLGGK